MKKILAIAALALATIFGNAASAGTSASMTVEEQGAYRLVSVYADPMALFQVFAYGQEGYTLAGSGRVQMDGVGRLWITAAPTYPPPGFPALYATIRNPDGTVFTVTVQDDGWWLE